MMEAEYRILLSSIDAFGHINCTLGFGELLRQAGCEVTFAHRAHYKKLADKRDFNFIEFDESIFGDDSEGPFVVWTEQNMEKFRLDPLKRYQGWSDEDKEIYSGIVNLYEKVDQALAKVLKQHGNTFDIIIGDFVTRFPALFYSPIPYIPLLSINPLAIYPAGPPAFSGYPVNVDKKTADEFEAAFLSANSSLKEKLSRWWKANNVEPLTLDWFLDEPKQFGFYHFPEKLDYTECGPKISDKWIRVDASIRQPDSDDEFIVPESLAKLPGQLIYFSLGSLGSADVDLMKKLISILAKSPHRFIVSKGPRGDEITLAPNMWGENYVNQIAILQVVDMVITHGGNNTFLETIFYGKPLVVLPFFFDQFDNAQRVVDCGIGRRLDTWNLEEDAVLNAIEETLADDAAKNKIASIANSMRSAESREKAVTTIKKMLDKRKAEQ